MADAKEVVWLNGGGPPKIRLFSGAKPATCATANSGVELANGDLPADPLGAAVNGIKSKSGTWSMLGIAAGVAGHFRIYKSDGVTCVEQGDVGTDMTINNTTIAIGLSVLVIAYSLKIGHE